MVSFMRCDGIALLYLDMITYNYTSFSSYYLFYYNSYFVG